MSSTTSKFKFVLPDGSDVFDKDKYLNGNFNLVESSIYSKTESDTNYAKKGQAPTWTTATFQNGFGSLGLSSGDPKYCKMDSGTVFIQGSCSCPASGFQNVNIFTLPAGYRPGVTLNYTLGSATIAIYSSGNVQYTAPTANTVQLGSISFPAEY